jgi:hypothetical protein
MPIDDILHDLVPEEAEDEDEYLEMMDRITSNAEARWENERDLELEDGNA